MYLYIYTYISYIYYICIYNIMCISIKKNVYVY